MGDDSITPARDVDTGRFALRAGAIALLPLLVTIGQYTVPSHWTSIWMDREFSGWVAPVANRLATGVKLYADGAHSPMAPLPYVLLYWVTRGHALWIHESAANYLCQSLAVLTLLVGFHRILPRPAALVAAFGLVLSFVSLPKVMLYDSLAQLAAAVTATLTVLALLEPTDEARRAKLPRAGVASAFGFLAKQSTGAGVVLGVLFAIWLSRGLGGTRERARLTARYLASAGGALLCLVVVLSPWIDVLGFARDVLLTSSEVKGGKDVLLHNLGRFGNQAWIGIVSAAVPPLAIAIAVMAYAALVRTRPEDAPVRADWPVIPTVLGAAAGSAASAFAVVKLEIGYVDVALQTVLLLALATLMATRFRIEEPPRWLRALGLFTAVTLPAAVTHSLSGDQFRWSYDNNPVVWVPLAFTATVMVFVLEARARTHAAMAAFFATFVVQSLTSGGFSIVWGLAGECTVSWPEVPFLRGALLRPEAEGMRHLIARVRDLAPAKSDAVLLLPNDPNVEAWFERPRPDLSSSIVFPDQYWDRYVDRDFAALEKRPPRVIVVGPRNFWRGFSHLWQPDRAAERLGLLVVNKLLPRRYRREEGVPIAFGAGDFMDVYVLDSGVDHDRR